MTLDELVRNFNPSYFAFPWNSLLENKARTRRGRGQNGERYCYVVITSREILNLKRIIGLDTSHHHNQRMKYLLTLRKLPVYVSHERVSASDIVLLFDKLDN